MSLNIKKDTMLTKIFVGGLPYSTSDETLHSHFKQFGDIEEAVVIRDKQTGKSKGYGFVTMIEPEEAKKATATQNPVIDGRVANVNLAYLGAKKMNTSGSNSVESPNKPQSPSQSSSPHHLKTSQLSMPSPPYGLFQGFYYPQMTPTGLQYFDVPYPPQYFSPFTHFAISPSVYGPQVAYIPQQYYNPTTNNNVPSPQLVPFPYVQ